MPRTSARPEREERSLGEAGPLHGSARSGAVARAGRALDHVPEVVEPPVGMFGVDVLHVRQPHPSLMHEDEWVDPFVGHRAGRQRLQDRHPHHPDQGRVLHEEGLSLRILNRLSHVPHPLFPTSNRVSLVLFRPRHTSVRFQGREPPEPSRDGAGTGGRHRARSGARRNA